VICHLILLYSYSYIIFHTYVNVGNDIDTLDNFEYETIGCSFLDGNENLALGVPTCENLEINKNADESGLRGSTSSKRPSKLQCYLNV